MNTRNDGEATLKGIVGARLTSVQFVLNHLILGFDEKGALTSLVWPEIVKDDDHVKFGMIEYRNRLCELVEHTISSVDVASDETIVIGLDNQTQLRIPLKSYTGTGERAIFTAPKHRLFVW